MSRSFGSLVKMFINDMPVTQGHQRWLDSDRKYSLKAVRFVANQLKQGNPNRKGKLSPSSISGCQKRVLLQWAGLPNTRANHGSDVMNSGTWSHLKWQAEGLTEGWLQAAEIVGFESASDLAGTCDGQLSDGSGFELKTTNSGSWARTKMNGEPPEAHLEQVHCYMRLTGMDTFSMVYENRDTADFIEFRVKKDEERMTKLNEKINALEMHTTHSTVPEMLPDCVKRTGSVFNQCPYRFICHEVNNL